MASPFFLLRSGLRYFICSVHGTKSAAYNKYRIAAIILTYHMPKTASIADRSTTQLIFAHLNTSFVVPQKVGYILVPTLTWIRDQAPITIWCEPTLECHWFGQCHSECSDLDYNLFFIVVKVCFYENFSTNMDAVALASRPWFSYYQLPKSLHQNTSSAKVRIRLKFGQAPVISCAVKKESISCHRAWFKPLQTWPPYEVLRTIKMSIL